MFTDSSLVPHFCLHPSTTHPPGSLRLWTNLATSVRFFLACFPSHIITRVCCPRQCKPPPYMQPESLFDVANQCSQQPSLPHPYCQQTPFGNPFSDSPPSSEQGDRCCHSPPLRPSMPVWLLLRLSADQSLPRLPSTSYIYDIPPHLVRPPPLSSFGQPFPFLISHHIRRSSLLPLALQSAHVCHYRSPDFHHITLYIQVFCPCYLVTRVLFDKSLEHIFALEVFFQMPTM